MFDPILYALLKRHHGSGGTSTIVKDTGKVVEQMVPSNVWVINHGLNRYPSVTVVDSANTVVIGDVEYIDQNNVRITFTNQFSGKVIFS